MISGGDMLFRVFGGDLKKGPLSAAITKNAPLFGGECSFGGDIARPCGFGGGIRVVILQL